MVPTIRDGRLLLVHLDDAVDYREEATVYLPQLAVDRQWSEGLVGVEASADLSEFTDHPDGGESLTRSRAGTPTDGFGPLGEAPPGAALPQQPGEETIVVDSKG